MFIYAKVRFKSGSVSYSTFYYFEGFKVMAQFYEKINDHQNSTFYKNKYEHWVKSIQKILYSPSDGIWFDYDIGQHKRRPYCYPTNFAPLWAEIFDARFASKMGKKALGSILDTSQFLHFHTSSCDGQNMAKTSLHF